MSKVISAASRANILRQPAVTLTASVVPLVTRTVVVKWLALLNTDTSIRTATVKDGNGIEIINALQLPASMQEPYTYPIPEDGLLFDGGVQWGASVTAKVRAWITMRTVD